MCNNNNFNSQSLDHERGRTGDERFFLFRIVHLFPHMRACFKFAKNIQKKSVFLSIGSTLTRWSASIKGLRNKKKHCIKQKCFEQNITISGDQKHSHLLSYSPQLYNESHEQTDLFESHCTFFPAFSNDKIFSHFFAFFFSPGCEKVALEITTWSRGGLSCLFRCWCCN